MADLGHIKEAAEIISRDFEMDDKEVAVYDDPSAAREELRKLLVEKITNLIDHEFELLLQILYRIDVGEAKVKKTLAEHPTADAPYVLADLIIERQIQKAKTREQFKSGGGDEMIFDV